MRAANRPLVLGQLIGVRHRVPARIRRRSGGGPHRAQCRTERTENRQRQHGVDVQHDHDRGLVNRSKHDRPDGERGVRPGEDRRFGPHLDSARQLMRGHSERVSLEPEAELQVVENFERVDPDFERASFVSERRAASCRRRRRTRQWRRDASTPFPSWRARIVASPRSARAATPPSRRSPRAVRRQHVASRFPSIAAQLHRSASVAKCSAPNSAEWLSVPCARMKNKIQIF